jgi:hypothetical protein
MSKRFPCALFVSVAAIFTAASAGFSTLANAVPAAEPAISCSTQTYSYAGVVSDLPAQGIEAVVTTVAAADVPSGHVAGWIGVGGPVAGPDGQPEWLQAGVNTEAGAGSALYVEIAQSGVPIKYLTVDAAVVPGSSYLLAVAQLPGKPNVWHVLVNGKPATGRIYLAGSSSFAPMAMGESWDGGTPGCNGFDYRFDQLRVTTGGAWKALTQDSVLTDLGYKVVDRTNVGFTALSGS